MTRPALTPRAYRWVDRATKLAGVALVAAGLEAGGGTALGLALGVGGAALAVSTVFVDTAVDDGSGPSDGSEAGTESKATSGSASGSAATPESAAGSGFGSRSVSRPGREAGEGSGSRSESSSRSASGAGSQ